MNAYEKAAKKRTKVVCTMGPSTEDEDVLRELIKCGMNVARLNFSHGSHEYHRKNIERVRRISNELGMPVAIMLDTKGPEIRTGLLVNHEPVMLKGGDQVILTTEDVEGTAERIHVDYADLPKEVEVGTRILVDDGLIELLVDDVKDTEIRCTINNGGRLSERKGVNLPGREVGLPAVTDQDRADIAFGCEMGIDAIAASFIRNGEAVKEIRALCAELGGPDILIFSKIESFEGVSNFDSILRASDGIMVARGDLGVEIPEEKVPYEQKSMIQRCNRKFKPVITATQMLDSMIRNPRPTRAEVTDVANAVYDGTDCVMLSGETAAGKYPVEALRTMVAVCYETEQHREENPLDVQRRGIRNVNSSIGIAAVSVAARVGATCIITPTHSGRTARLLAASRPKLPIYAFSSQGKTIRRCNFFWGVTPQLIQETQDNMAACYLAIDTTKRQGITAPGDLVVVTSGDPRTVPYDDEYVSSTNLFMVAQVH